MSMPSGACSCLLGTGAPDLTTRKSEREAKQAKLLESSLRGGCLGLQGCGTVVHTHSNQKQVIYHQTYPPAVLEGNMLALRAWSHAGGTSFASGSLGDRGNPQLLTLLPCGLLKREALRLRSKSQNISSSEKGAASEQYIEKSGCLKS